MILTLNKQIKMKSVLFAICCILLMNSHVAAQEYKTITVKAGTRVKDSFPFSERYLYPEFTKGTVTFKNRIVAPCLFNFNFLSGEIEFIKSKDTLIFTMKKEIDLIVIAKDSFYCNDTYLQLLHRGLFSVYLKRGMDIVNILKQGAMGTVNRSSASQSYESTESNHISIDLQPVDDMVLKKKDEYFFSFSGNDYLPLNKKNILRNLPGMDNEIRSYLKSNRVDFDSRQDVLRLTGFVNNLLEGRPNYR